MLDKITKFFWGLILIPLTAASCFHLPTLFFGNGAQWDSLTFIFLGAAVYFVFEGLFSRPMRTYVFGHELTHALASMAVGGQVHSFHVSQKGGSVTLSKSNFFVALAPYCVPLYTLMALLAYFIVRTQYPQTQVRWAALALTGATLAFHGSLTLFAIRQEQPDIKKTGTFFSLVFILLMNAWFLALISKLLFWRTVPLWVYTKEVFSTQAHIWIWLYEKIYTVLIVKEK